MSEDKKDKIQFFSESDYTVLKDGRKIVSSEYPAWYNEQVLDEMKSEVERIQLDFKHGFIKESNIPVMKSKLDRLEKKMAQIEQSIPSLSPETEERIAKMRKQMSKEIASRQFTRKEMELGLVDAYQEAKRMVQPSIPVDEKIAEFAEACNVPIQNGKITRTGAEKIFKICSRVLGEISDTEVLRPDK